MLPDDVYGCNASEVTGQGGGLDSESGNCHSDMQNTSSMSENRIIRCWMLVSNSTPFVLWKYQLTLKKEPHVKGF